MTNNGSPSLWALHALYVRYVCCVQVFGTTQVPFKELPLLEVRLPDAVPEAFDMVLNYIYTDRIDPTKKSKCILLPSRISTARSANKIYMCPTCD
jgi:hypothetical protein